jgi:tetratricopeptide (TPR) repeat protein
LYHLLSGKPPFLGRDPEEIGAKILNRSPEPLRGAPSALARVVGRSMSREKLARYPSVQGMAEDLQRYLERSRPASRTRVVLWGGLLLAMAVPWVVTFSLLLKSQKSTDRELVLEALRAGDRILGQAEQLRADPQGTREDVERTARRAMPSFTLALRWAGGVEPEASAGLGRTWELIGNEKEAEEAYRAAESVPAGRSGLARLALGRWLSGRTDADWRAKALTLAGPGTPLRAFLEGQGGADDSYDDVLLLAQAAAAIDRKDWDGALRRLDQAGRLRRGDPLVSYFRGVALQGRGDRKAAADAFRDALKSAPALWPRRPDAQSRLEQLN